MGGTALKLSSFGLTFRKTRMSDQEFKKRIIAGEKKAIRRFCKRHSEKLLNFILTKIDNPQDAEEILQDTFVSALDSLPLFEGRSTLFTWLAGIAKHEIADFYRKKKIKRVVFSRLPFLERLAHQALGPEEELMEQEVKRRIKKVLGELSEGYRQILRLKYQREYRVAEISQKLGISYKAAESRLSRARLAFRESWLQENEKLDCQLSEKSFFQPSS